MVSDTVVIYHLGPRMDRGHYTAHVCLDANWFYCDDRSIFPASVADVLRPAAGRDAYILLYTKAQSL